MWTETYTLTQQTYSFRERSSAMRPLVKCGVLVFATLWSAGDAEAEFDSSKICKAAVSAVEGVRLSAVSSKRTAGNVNFGDFILNEETRSYNCRVDGTSILRSDDLKSWHSGPNGSHLHFSVSEDGYFLQIQEVHLEGDTTVTRFVLHDF